MHENHASHALLKIQNVGIYVRYFFLNYSFSVSMVSRLVRNTQTNNVNDFPRSGRPRVTSEDCSEFVNFVITLIHGTVCKLQSDLQQLEHR